MSWCFLESPRSSGFLDESQGPAVFIAVSKTAEIWLPSQTSQHKGYVSHPAGLTTLLGQHGGTRNEPGSPSLFRHTPVWKPDSKEASLEVVLGKVGFPGSATVLCASPWSPPLVAMIQFHQKVVSKAEALVLIP